MNQESFERLLRPELAPAYRYALRLTKNSSDAEDLLQEASVQAFRGRETFQVGTNFRAWFFKVLTNQFYRRVRKKQVDTQPLDDAQDAFIYRQAYRDGRPIESDDPAGFVFDQLSTERVRAAIDDLPIEYREVCALFFVNEMSYDEIAEILQIPIGTVRSRLHRGRKYLQKSLYDMAQESGVATQ